MADVIPVGNFRLRVCAGALRASFYTVNGSWFVADEAQQHEVGVLLR